MTEVRVACDFIMSFSLPAPLISVIVPVYRAEQVLARCVDSLLAQTYTHLEIILVEDGSPDNSGLLCDAYAAKDERIRVLHQTNAGPSTARNKGMQAADGDFICFVDADDYVDKDYIAHFTEGLADEVDLVFQGICEIRDGNAIRKVPCARMYDKAALGNAIADINTQSMFGYVCNKCYRRSIIEEHHLRFRTDISLSEDRIFALEYMLYVRRMQVMAGCSYYYELQHSGLTLKRRAYEELKAAADANLKAALQLLQLSPSKRFEHDTRRMYVMNAIAFLSALFRDGGSYGKQAAAMKEFLAQAGAWLPLYHPATTDQKMLCRALRMPLFLGIPLMKCYWKLKRMKHEIAA